MFKKILILTICFNGYVYPMEKLFSLESVITAAQENDFTQLQKQFNYFKYQSVNHLMDTLRITGKDLGVSLPTQITSEWSAQVDECKRLYYKKMIYMALRTAIQSQSEYVCRQLLSLKELDLCDDPDNLLQMAISQSWTDRNNSADACVFYNPNAQQGIIAKLEHRKKGLMPRADH